VFHLPNEKKLGFENETKVHFESIKNPLHETFSKEPNIKKLSLRK
jgi:hypothetical protein